MMAEFDFNIHKKYISEGQLFDVGQQQEKVVAFVLLWWALQPGHLVGHCGKKDTE